MNNRQRVLVISRCAETRNALVTLLSGYGYFVEFCGNRREGVRKFRDHKQGIVILDVPALRFSPERMFKFIRLVCKNTIVLIAAQKQEERNAFQRLHLGAYDILQLPLKTEFLKLTLSRALDHHRIMLQNSFIKNAVFFTSLMFPIWAWMAFLFLR